MLGFLLLVLFVGFILWQKPEDSKSTNALPDNLSLKIDKLWKAAQEALIDRKWL